MATPVPTLRASTGRRTSPYRRKFALLSRSEALFYRALRQATADRYVIFAKVRLLDLCFGLERRDNYVAFQKVAQKHVDFVLCEPQTFRPVLVIELDDPSHLRQDRLERDLFLDEMFNTMGLPFMSQWVQPTYGRAELARRIEEKLAN